MTQSTLETLPQFPSDADRNRLLLACQILDANGNRIGLDDNKLSDADRWFWHAYDYGFRRMFLNNQQPYSPIDPEGDWYDAALAAAVEIFYRRKFHKPIYPADPLSKSSQV